MSDDDGVGVFHRHNTIVYLIIWTSLAVLLVIALIAYRGAKENEKANEKAEQFIALLQKAGVQRLPSQDQVVRVLGDDGGSTCQDPNNALRQATLHSMMTNGAAGPGMRPIITDSRLFRGQLAVISVYCPDELQDFQDFVDDLKTGDVVRS
jgi:hypothetical protein